MKIDPRARYTRKVITDAFVELWKEKPLAKITVREVCDIAQINRSTFYKYFKDCYDLRDQLEEEALDQMDALLAGIETAGVRPVLTSMLRFLQGNGSVLTMKADPTEMDAFTRQMIARCFRLMERWLPEGPKGAEQGMYYAFLAGGADAVISYWIRRGMPEPPEQVAETIALLYERVPLHLSEKDSRR